MDYRRVDAATFKSVETKDVEITYKMKELLDQQKHLQERLDAVTLLIEEAKKIGME
jgi:hypothetical protein